MQISRLIGMAAKGLDRSAKAEKQPSLLSRMLSQPESFKLEAYIEQEELVIRVRKRLSSDSSAPSADPRFLQGP